MRNKLICYIEGLFEGVPDTPQVRELKEEILQNTLDRYDEECSKGAAETVAYNTAVMSIGDVDGLLAEFRSPKKEKKGFRRVCLAIAIALYILCVVPPIIADALGWPDAVGASLLFLLIDVIQGVVLSNNVSEPAIGQMELKGHLAVVKAFLLAAAAGLLALVALAVGLAHAGARAAAYALYGLGGALRRP